MHITNPQVNVLAAEYPGHLDPSVRGIPGDVFSFENMDFLVPKKGQQK